jgi:hypothetical protein
MRISRILTLSSVLAVGLTVGVATSASASTQVALWNMGDAGTTMTDASGNGHDGKLTNVAVGQPGYAGSGFGFLSTPSYVTVSTASQLNPGTQAFSVTLHIRFSVRPSSSVGDYDLLRKGLATTSGGSYKMEILGGGNAFCNYRGSQASGSVSSGSNLADNTWHTITCARTSTTVRLTVDAKTYSKSVSTGTISNSSSLYIGAKNGGGEDQYKGLMDLVTVSQG